MKPHVLIVDDDELVLSGLAVSLENEGYEVSTAPNGTEALVLVGRTSVHLVLTDLVMEGMDGLELLRRIKQASPDLPVVVITGHGTARSALDAVREGAADYIQKPARPEEIAHRIQTVLAAQDLRRRLAAERDRDLERQARRELHSARAARMRSLEVFARGVAGELRPFADLLREAPESARAALGPDFGPRFSSLERLLDHLAEFTTPAAAGADPLDLNELVRAALDAPAWRAQCDLHPGVRIDTRLREGLPALAGAAAALREALQILLGRLLPAAGPTGRLAVATGQEHFQELGGHYAEGASGRYVFVRIQTSARADEADFDRLFEPYHAGPCVGTSANGFDLTRVYGCIRRHHGFIQVRTDPAAGTEFQILFPALESGAVPAGTVAAPPEAGRILVLDDTPSHREHTVRLLRNLGYETDEAGSSAEALARARDAAGPGEQGYVCFVIDLVLGEALDGVDTLRALLEIQPGVPAVLLGGFADIDRIGEARDAGAAHYVRKPATRESLGRAVRDAIAG